MGYFLDEAQDLEKVLHDLHNGIVRGHFTGDITTQKVMRENFYWPTLFKGAHTYAHKCLVCLRCFGEGKKLFALLQPIDVEEPFQQWGLGFIGEILLHSLKHHHYIITATE